MIMYKELVDGDYLSCKIYADLDAVQNAIVSSSHPEFHAEVDLQDISYSDLNNYFTIMFFHLSLLSL